MLIEHVISIAPLSESAMSAAIVEKDPELIAEVVLLEVAARTGTMSGPAEAVYVQWDLGFSGKRFGYVMTLDPQAPRLDRGWRSDADVVIRQDLIELIRELFAAVGRHDATQEVRITVPDVEPDTDPIDPLRKRRVQAVQAARQAVGALSRRHANLTDLAVQFGSDKWGMHWYTSIYERYFGAYRDLPVKILEIGIGGSGEAGSGGASLRMWKHYFRRGIVYGLDIYDKSHVAEPRVRVLQGDQGDFEFLNALGKDVGPFDIIIDDGSHVNQHVITSFSALFPHLRTGGLYVVEDVQTSYWPGWGGSSTELNSSSTTIGFIKTLVDGLNHQEMVRESEYKPSLTDRTVAAVHLHHNIAFIENGVNTEDGAPTWVSHAASALFL